MSDFRGAAAKLAQINVAFWAIKIIATTLGETGGDALSMTLDLGYAVSTGIFFAFFLVAVSAQIGAKRYHPFLYWTVIVATTTVGTTTADYLTRSTGLGYPLGSLILFALLLLVLGVWRWSTGSVSIASIRDRKGEALFWSAILVSNTLGTALGDYLATSREVGFAGGALVFSGLLLVLAGLYFFTRVSRPFLFWAAFILTRPLGATLGDLLTKPIDEGGLNLSRISSSLVLAVAMVPLVYFLSRRPETPTRSSDASQEL